MNACVIFVLLSSSDACASNASRLAGCGLVLSRFLEPIDWALPLIDAGIDVTVLNRGPWDSFKELIPTRERAASEDEWCVRSPDRGRLHVHNHLSNVGRESFAYVEYMVQRATSWQHRLTVFCQAQPKHKLYSSAELLDDMSRLCGVRASGPPHNTQHERIAAEVRRTGFAFLSRCSPPFHPDTFADQAMKVHFRAAFMNAFNASSADYEALRWCPNGCFALTHDGFANAYARRRGTFEELARMLGSSNRPIEAELLERAWGALFSQSSIGRRRARGVTRAKKDVPLTFHVLRQGV